MTLLHKHAPESGSMIHHRGSGPAPTVVRRFTPQNQQGSADVAPAVNSYLKSSRTPRDRQQAVQAITQAAGMSEAQTNQMLTNLERAGQQAKETGEKAANVTAGTFIGPAIAMINRVPQLGYSDDRPK